MSLLISEVDVVIDLSTKKYSPLKLIMIGFNGFLIVLLFADGRSIAALASLVVLVLHSWGFAPHPTSFCAKRKRKALLAAYAARFFTF